MALRYFQLLPKVGKHVHSDGETYVSGDIVSYEDDAEGKNLLEKLPGKFIEVSKPSTKTPKVVIDEDEDDDEVEEVKPKVKGIDKTKMFPKCKKAHLTVLKKGKEYFVYDNDDQDNPLNKKPLARKDVEKFINDTVASASNDNDEDEE